MSKIVKVVGYVDSLHNIELELIEAMKIKVDELKSQYMSMFLKLYVWSTELDKIIIVTSTLDVQEQELQDAVLTIADINSYPLSRMHSSLIEYYEIIASPKGNLVKSHQDILDVAQFKADELLELDKFTKLPIVKIVDYKFNNEPILILPSAFGVNSFSVAPVFTTGNLNNGNALLNAKHFTTAKDAYLNEDLKVEGSTVFIDGNECTCDGTYWVNIDNEIVRYEDIIDITFADTVKEYSSSWDTLNKIKAKVLDLGGIYISYTTKPSSVRGRTLTTVTYKLQNVPFIPNGYTKLNETQCVAQLPL